MLIETVLVVVMDTFVCLQDVVEIWWCYHSQLKEALFQARLRIVRRA